MAKRLKALRFLLYAGTAITFPTLAAADPVTLVGLAVTAGTAAASAAISSATVAALVTAAISIAGTLARQLLTPTRSVDRQVGGRTREMKAHPAFRRAYGEFPLEGALVFKHVEGQRLYLAYLLSDSRCDSISKIEINDGIELNILSDAENDITDMAKGAGTDTLPYDEDSNAGQRIVKFWFGDGTQTQFPQEFLDEIGEDGPEGDFANIVSSSDTWSGSSVLWVKLFHGGSRQQNKRWGLGAPPPFRIFGKWSKVYDPRKDSTSGVSGASGAHRPDDESTWEWSSNPALCALDMMRWSRGLAIADERILIQSVADAADACEVEDGGVSEAELHSQDWGTLPAAQVIDTDAGSGVWTFNRGSVELGTGTIAGFTDGLACVFLSSEDTDGTVVESELGRMGVYIDMVENGRGADITYILKNNWLVGTPGSNDFYRWKKYQADKSTDGSTASAADQRASFMPPDATNITLVYDTEMHNADGGVDPFDPDETSEVQGRYVSYVFEGGGPNEEHLEVGPTSLLTTSQAAKSRFRCDGLVVVETSEWSILDGILDSMAGFLDTAAGKIGLRAGVWEAPADTLSQPIGEGFEYAGRSDTGFDKVVASYISASHDFEATSEGTEYALRAGDRTQSINLSMVREPEQAARIAKITALRGQYNRTLTVFCSGQEWSRRIGERVTVSIPDFPRADMTGLIVRWQPVLEAVEGGGFRLRVGLTLKEDAEAIYDWGASDYDEVEVQHPTDNKTPTMAAPTSVVAEQENYRDAGDNAVARAVATIAMTSDAASSADETEVQININATGWAALTTINSPSTSNTASKDPAFTGSTYQFRARNRSSLLGDSAWVESNTITIVAPTLEYDTSDYSTEYA